MINKRPIDLEARRKRWGGIDLDFLIQRETSLISIGLEPSGPLHLGTAFAAYQAMIVLKNN